MSRSFELSLLLLNGWGFPGSEGWNVPSWSVSSEWFASTCGFPMIAMVVPHVRTRRHAVTLMILILVSTWFLGGLSLPSAKIHVAVLGVLVRVTTEFCLGCLAYRFFTEPLEARVARTVAELSLAAIVLVSVLALPATLDVLTIAAFVALVVGLSRANGILGAALRSRIAVYLGRISYSAYVVHFVLAVYARALRLLPASAGFLIETLVVLGFIALVIPSAHVLHAIIEEPARRWLRRSWVDRDAPRLRAAPSIP